MVQLPNNFGFQYPVFTLCIMRRTFLELVECPSYVSVVDSHITGYLLCSRSCHYHACLSVSDCMYTICYWCCCDCGLSQPSPFP